MALGGAVTVSELQARLSVDQSSRAKFNRDLTAADKKMGDTSKSGARSFAALGRAAKAGFLVAGAAVVAGAGYSVKAASDLGESMNAVEVVFGKASKKLHEFGKTAATSAGLSERAFNEAVTPIGAALRNVGMGADAAAEKSIALTQRAADMASVFNVDVSEALTAIQAGLRGEADPLERFGVGLNETAIQAYAVKTGMVSANAELTNAQKIQARLGLLMEQTNRVAGDFSNTSDGLANSTRILRARVENLAAGFGQVLMPAILAVVGFLNDHALPALEQFEGFVKRVFGARTLRAKLNVVWDGVRNTVRNLFDKIREALFGTESKPLKLKTGQILEWDTSSTQGLVDKFAASLNLADWTDLGTKIGEGIGNAIKFGANTLTPMLDQVSEWIDSHSKQIGEMGLKIVLSMVNAMGDPKFWRENWALILSVALTVLPVGRVFKLGEKLATLVGRAFGETAEKIFTRFVVWLGTKFAGGILGALRKAFTLTAVYSFISGVESLIKRMVEFIKDQWDRLPGWARTVFKTIASLFRIFVINPIDIANAKIRGFFQWIRNGINAVTSPLQTLGNIFGGIKDKISGLNPFGDGIVGLAANPGGLQPQILDDLGLAQSMGLSLMSGYRPGAVTSTGNPSLHAVGKAIDVAGSESAMRAFFLREVARGASSGLAEIIHSPYWWHPGVGITSIPSTAGTVLADHYNHVHVGTYDQGGFLRPGWNLAYNGLGRNEPVGMGNVYNFNGPVLNGDALLRYIASEDAKFVRRNGRSAL